MNEDEWHALWRQQPTGIQLSVEQREQLDHEVRQFERQFSRELLRRDLLEIGTALILIPIWIFLGLRNGLPWTWFLTVPGLAWIAGYLWYRRLHDPSRPLDNEVSLDIRTERSLAQVENQISLLQHVLWWGLLPLAAPMLLFVTQTFWQSSSFVWLGLTVFSAIVLVVAVIFYGVYRMNRNAVRRHLLPRRDELQAQLRSLRDEL